MNLPIVSVDYETKDLRGASFESFRKDFQIFSLACTWRDPKTQEILNWFSTSPYSIRHKLAELARTQTPVVAHNAPFEMAVTARCHPDLNINWYADTMRLCQTRDAGGDEFSEPILTFEQTVALELGEMTEADVKKSWAKTRGLSLEACSARFLPDDRHNHKQEAHQYLLDNFKIKNHHGRYLDKLPYDILSRYNLGDTLNTLLLYETQVEFFKSINYDWKKDHILYFDRARLINGAYSRGIQINRGKLYQYILKLEKEIKDIETAFFAEFSISIAGSLAVKRNDFMEKYLSFDAAKTIRGRWKRLVRAEAGELDLLFNKFNIGSSKDLETLFCRVLKMTPKFLTPKGAPSFKSTHLSQWGQGGEILLKRKKILLVLQQCVNTWIGSELTGNAHPSIRAAGTRTNRVASGFHL